MNNNNLDIVATNQLEHVIKRVIEFTAQYKKVSISDEEIKEVADLLNNDEIFKHAATNITTITVRQKGH